MSPLQKTLVAAAIPAILLFLALLASPEKPKTEVLPSIDIGLEHTLQMTLSLSVTRNGTLRMIDIANDTKEAVYIVVPDDWARSEVRGVALAEVTSEPPTFGYVRWRFPIGASVSFRTSRPFEKINIHNPSETLTEIRYTKVDLQNNSAEHDVYLVKGDEIELP